MKKFAALLLATLLAVVPTLALADTEVVTLTIGATPTPHVEILEAIHDQLAEQGIELNIITYTDYIQPNEALAAGELDANYFQHKPYMDDFNATHGTNLVALIPVHYEPMGLFPSRTATIEELQPGAIIGVPNDTTNEARALELLQANGIIKLREGLGLPATKLDVVENPYGVEIQEVEAAQLPLLLPDFDMAVINGNYAVQAGLTVTENAIAKEESDSTAANTYVNYVVVNGDSYDAEVFEKLAAVLTSEETVQWITDNYGGAVLPFLPIVEEEIGEALEEAAEELAEAAK